MSIVSALADDSPVDRFKLRPSPVKVNPKAGCCFLKLTSPKFSVNFGRQSTGNNVLVIKIDMDINLLRAFFRKIHLYTFFVIHTE